MIQASLFSQASGLVHGFSDVHDGNMAYRFGEPTEVRAARQKFLGSLGLGLGDCVAQRGLSDGIVVVAPVDRGAGMVDVATSLEANALITNQPGIGLFLTTADCLPIILYDPVQRVVALLHAARQSTNLELVAQVMERLRNDFSCQPADLLVALGPTIQAESYIYDQNIFQLVSKAWQPYIKPHGEGRFSVDVVGYNLEQLHCAGVMPEHIQDVHINTRTNADFFSHVRSHDEHTPEGRFATAVALKP